MQTARDPILNMLANSVDELTAFQAADAELLARGASLRLKNCYFSAVSRKWETKIYLGGTQRVLGRTKSPGIAAHFSDAAQIFFWKYRRNTSRDPLDCDLNFSVEQAKFDLANIGPLTQILTEIEAYLVEEKSLELPIKVRKSSALTTEQLQKQLWLAWNKFELVARRAASQLELQSEAKFVHDTFLDSVGATKTALKSVHHWLGVKP